MGAQDSAGSRDHGITGKASRSQRTKNAQRKAPRTSIIGYRLYRRNAPRVSPARCAPGYALRGTPGYMVVRRWCSPGLGPTGRNPGLRGTPGYMVVRRWCSPGLGPTGRNPGLRGTPGFAGLRPRVSAWPQRGLPRIGWRDEMHEQTRSARLPTVTPRPFCGIPLLRAAFEFVAFRPDTLPLIIPAPPPYHDDG